jgi:hypothetical protein
MSTNLSLPAQAIVAQLVSDLYGVTLPSTAVWSPPVAYSPILEDTYQRDTAVTLTQPDGSVGITGSATIRYSRISLASLSTGDSYPIEVTQFPVSVESLLPQINAAYGLDLTLADVLNTTYTTAEGPFLLTANPTSWAWKGIAELDLEVVSSGA